MAVFSAVIPPARLSHMQSIPISAPPARQCPVCESLELRRSRRHGVFERYLLTPLGLFPYRCEVCYKRFYSRRRKSVKSANVDVATNQNSKKVEAES